MARWIIYLISTAALLITAGTLSAQPSSTDEQLAAQYFQTGDYEKAILYYERLFKKQQTPFYYDQLYKSYLALQQYDEAEKLVKDRMKRSDDPRFAIDLGMLYRGMGKNDKATQEFEKVIKGLQGNTNDIRQVANAFIRAGDADMALATYERGQKLLKNEQSFHYEMAGLYGSKGDMERMVGAYLDLIEVNEGYVQAVQNGLSRYIDFTLRDARSDVLRTELLRRVQRNATKTIFHEMLIWMYIQQKDVDAAFVQARALDKRFDEGGMRLLELANIAMNNGDARTAVKGYEYVISLGRNDAIYLQARTGKLKAERMRLMGIADPPREELEDLRRAYIHTLDELGRSIRTVDLMEDLADLEAHYLNDLDAATTVLEQALTIPGLDASIQGLLKLRLGDVHLFKGEIWDASLLYSQVDLDFKYDALGHEARLRNAKVSFYAGDLLWCKAQLDILKASTSKLIANDAMELSLLISDHIGVDSNSVPLNYYAHADLLIFQRRYDEAIAVLDTLELEYPMHDIGDDILYQRFRIAKARKQYTEAAGYLDKVLEFHPLGILVDNALFDLGKLYEDELHDEAKAMETYQRLLFEHTGSIFIPEARDRFRRLRGDLPEQDLETPPDPHAP